MSNSVKAIMVAIIIIACLCAACVLNILLKENYTFPESLQPLVMFLIVCIGLAGIVGVVRSKGPRINPREERPRQEPRQNHQDGQNRHIRR